MLMTTLALVAVFAFQDNSACEDASTVCRTVPAFSLSVGSERTDPINVGKQPWIDANGRVVLFPEESVTVKWNAEGSLAVAAIQNADDVVSDERLAQLLAQAEPMSDPKEETVGILSTKPMSDPLAEGIRLTFRQATNSEHMILFVENATDGPLAYNAGMLVPGPQGMVWQPTTICIVRQGVFSVEHWQHAIMSLSLGDFERGPEPPADGSICG